MNHQAEIDVQSPPENFVSGRLASSVVVPGNIVVYGFTVYNSGAAQYLLVFDANTVPAESAVPLFSMALAATTAVGVAWPSNGRRFKTGLVLVASSTDKTKTINATPDCFFDVQYQALYALTSEDY